jgi:hypothetical protein
MAKQAPSDVNRSGGLIGEPPMTESKFEARVKATGLRPKPDDMAMLEALVKDLDRAAAMLRGPRSYAEEPLNAFRLKPA